MSEIGESPHVAIPQGPEEKEQKKEPCKRIYLHAFSGCRERAFLESFKSRLELNKSDGTPGPSGDECLVYTGHVGISFEAQSPIYGFNPSTGSDPVSEVIRKLKAEEAYPGQVTDDTSAFSLARSFGLTVETIEFVYPESRYNELKAAFEAQKSGTKYRYSFPSGAGDCNCATWPGKIDIPIPSANGNMKVYIVAMKSSEKVRRMGECEG